MARELLSGWGRTAASAADVIHPVCDADVESAMAASSCRDPIAGGLIARGLIARGLIARGSGRSYGDAAQNAGGAVLSTRCLDGFDWADRSAGLVWAAGGALLGDVAPFVLAEGWALPVLPGTRHVSIGGAIAADIHGKNHRRDGSFMRHVVEITLATPGAVHRITAATDPDLYWATAGGLGLTGVVLQATIQAVRVETSAVRVVSRRFGHLDGLMDAMKSAEARHRYTVAWLDAMAQGGASGRGVVSWGDDAAVADLAPLQRARPLTHEAARSISVPDWFSAGPPPARTVRVLNDLRFRRSAPAEITTVEPLDRFLFPLDGLDGWNRLYGRAGLVQYQFVVPFGAEHIVRVALERLRRAGCPPFLAVLKLFGAADPGPMSFPMPGWTLALDIPAAAPALAATLDELDELVAGAGGRVYLAKDARLRPELLGAMYPGLPRWQELQRRFDPEGVLTSDLARRLGLAGGGDAGARRFPHE